MNMKFRIYPRCLHLTINPHGNNEQSTHGNLIIPNFKLNQTKYITIQKSNHNPRKFLLKTQNPESKQLKATENKSVIESKMNRVIQKLTLLPFQIWYARFAMMERSPLEAKQEESQIFETYRRSFRRHSDQPRQKSHEGRFTPISRRRSLEQTEARISVFPANDDWKTPIPMRFCKKLKSKIHSVALFLVWKTLCETKL